MASTAPLQQVDPGDAYQVLFDLLGRAYWDASDLDSKDLLHGAQMAVGDILHAIDKDELTRNTALFLQMKPKIDATNAALREIQTGVAKITRNIDTASKIIQAIAKVLSIFPA